MQSRPLMSIHRLRYLEAYREQSTDSSSDFLFGLIPYCLKRGIDVHGNHNDNDFKFTKHLLMRHMKKWPHMKQRHRP